jgi:hypothetical protein
MFSHEIEKNEMNCNNYIIVYYNGERIAKIDMIADTITIVERLYIHMFNKLAEYVKQIEY